MDQSERRCISNVALHSCCVAQRLFGHRSQNFRCLCCCALSSHSHTQPQPGQIRPTIPMSALYTMTIEHSEIPDLQVWLASGRLALSQPPRIQWRHLWCTKIGLIYVTTAHKSRVWVQCLLFQPLCLGAGRSIKAGVSKELKKIIQFNSNPITSFI